MNRLVIPSLATSLRCFLTLKLNETGLEPIVDNWLKSREKRVFKTLIVCRVSLIKGGTLFLIISVFVPRPHLDFKGQVTWLFS